MSGLLAVLGTLTLGVRPASWWYRLDHRVRGAVTLLHIPSRGGLESTLPRLWESRRRDVIEMASGKRKRGSRRLRAYCIARQRF